MSAALHRFAAAPTRLDPATGIFTGYASLFGIPFPCHFLVHTSLSLPLSFPLLRLLPKVSKGILYSRVLQ